MTALGESGVNLTLDGGFLTAVHLSCVNACTDGFPNLIVHSFVRVAHAAVHLPTSGAESVPILLHGIP